MAAKHMKAAPRGQAQRIMGYPSCLAANLNLFHNSHLFDNPLDHIMMQYIVFGIFSVGYTERINNSNPCFQGTWSLDTKCSLNIKVTLLANLPLNDERVQIHCKIRLTEIAPPPF